MNSDSLQKRYFDKICYELKDDLGYKSIMAVPRLVKIVLNRGEGAAVNDKKRIGFAIDELSLIAGQKAVPTVAKKSISNFKLREGVQIGAKVTLRGSRMYDFFDRLVSLALPRIRDFRGVSVKSFDEHGNYNLGIKEQIIFPELSLDSIQHVVGLNITIAVKSKSVHDSFLLLKKMGMPFIEK